MNQTMYDRAMAIINSPDFVDNVLTDLRKRHDQREAFKLSATFAAMCDSLRNFPGQVDVDSEECSYLRQAVNERLGWHQYTEDDVNNFFSVMSQPSDPTACVECDEDNPFDNESFVNYGLNVFRMTGQGTFIRISNIFREDQA